ncbi:LysR family transcriptional regulator [Diaphorobacter sp. HDW4A]|uniref:LysR family transcriptional regulator n=1 Tax=Diaphorobacter sp. HDW4A TaxID=2714924 RepID=UPI001F0F7BD5|nr:LysR family transcriptional regulator [Diaphorobacter sp. HDW4A]
MNYDALPLADLEVFAHVVERSGFAAAARELGLTTSAVSRSVGRLELRLGVKLLHRTTRALSLTEVGAEVHAACRHMLQNAEEAVSLAAAHRQQPQGVLRISAPVVFGDLWLAPLLPQFCSQWPEVHVQLGMSDAMVDLQAQGIDLAIRITTHEALPQSLVAHPLREVRYLLVAHPDYFKTHTVPKSPADLAAHRCMTLGYGAFQNLVEFTPADAADASVAPPPVKVRLNTPLTIASSLGLLQALRADAQTGVGLVVDFVAEPAIAAGQLVQVLPHWQLTGSYAPRMAYAVHAPGPRIPPKLRAMLDFLLQHAKAAPR